ncbi:uncharacterized protein, partial [Littorina saxatilis]|uniref:uncharacterized protein n=1 Tax=Littorina saxatilis TaxID=31220 RepID=UPI0038B68FBF
TEQQLLSPRESLFPPEKPRQVSFVLVVSVTVGVIVVITVITIITVCCLRSKNNRGATQDTSQQPPVSCGDTYYLHPINPDAVPKPVHTENSHACRQQSHTRSDEDDDGYTFPDLPRSAGRKRDVPKPVYRNTRVSGDTAKPKGRTSKPSDDGYILPDPVHPDKIKRGDDQSFLDNTDATNTRSVARRAPRSHKYDDEGYVAPNPAVSNQRGQVPKTSLYQNTNPVTGQAKANSKKFDDDGYVMSDRLTRCKGKVDTYF